LLVDCYRYRLDVEATDGGIPRRIGVTQIAIQVINVNDNSPRFDRSFYSEEVSEGKHNHVVVPMQYSVSERSFEFVCNFYIYI
jgi:hypothetical protein